MSCSSESQDEAQAKTVSSPLYMRYVAMLWLDGEETWHKMALFWILVHRSPAVNPIGKFVDSSTSRLSSFLSSDSVSFSHLSANFPHLPSKPTFRSADEMLPKKANEILSNPEQGICFREIDEGLASRLHVSNLPFIFREPHLARLFSSYGTVVDAQVVTNEKGSKGFGFVSMSNSEEAAMARRMLHGTVVEGRRIEVNPATPKVRMGARLPITAVLQNYPSQMLELVEAQTRLAEAQVIFICIEKCFGSFDRKGHFRNVTN